MVPRSRIGAFLFRLFFGVDHELAGPRVRIAGFAFRVLLFYGLLTVVPWPGLHDGYSAFSRSVGNAIFGSFGSTGVVRFLPLTDAARGMDTEIAISNPVRSRVVGRLPHSNWFSGFLPTAEAIALILATPIPWPRRWRALLWGMLLVNGFVVLRLWVTLLHGFSLDYPCALYHPSQFWSKTLTDLYNYFALSATCSFVIPALIWILVSLRASDLEVMASPRQTKHPNSAS